jgi:uncharacterized protein (DUF488 family)
MPDLILYTIGYGNRQPEAFFALLPADCTLIDVRRNPTGWHGEYKAPSLRRRLGRRYLSWPALGNISGKASVWMAPHNHATTVKYLEALASHVQTGGCPVVIMCSEADPQQCHRRFVAERVAEMVHGLRIVHLPEGGNG